MANGRLASKKVLKGKAEKVYTNTSAVSAAVSIHASAHSENTNTNLSLAVDTNATHNLNYVTEKYLLGYDATTNIMALDTYSAYPLGSIAHNIGDIEWSSIQGPRMSYSTSGALGAARSSGTTTNYLRLDPYYLTNPEEYGGKTKPSYITNNSSSGMYYWHDITTGGSQSIGNVVARVYGQDYASADYNTTVSSHNRGMVVDVYKNDAYHDACINWDNNSYMSITSSNATGTTINHQAHRTSDSNFYNCSNNGRDPSSYLHPWYQGVAWFEKGVYVFNAASIDRQRFCMGDFIRASDGAIRPDCIKSSHGTGNQSYQFNSSVPYPVCWMKYNPNNDKYYIAVKQDGIFEFDKSQLNTGSSSRQINEFTAIGPMPHEQMATPVRIDKALWHSVDSTYCAWVTTDFKTWIKATTYWDSQGFGTNAAMAYNTTREQVNLGERKVFVASSGFDSVADDAILEYKTSFNSYERNGLLLNSGDILYAENTGSVDLSVSVMGYEDE